MKEYHSCCECSKEAKYCKDNLFYCNKHGKKTQYKIPEKAIKTVENEEKIYSLYVIL